MHTLAYTCSCGPTYHDSRSRQDVIQVDQGEVHLIADALDHTRVVNGVVYQGLELWELEAVPE
jgi:hypothetical protein